MEILEIINMITDVALAGCCIALIICLVRRWKG